MTRKRKIIALAFLITSLACSCNRAENNASNTEITEEDSSKKFTLGNVYIGDKDYLDSIEGKEDNDILVLDQRDAEDPNIKIIDSFRVNDPDAMDEVLYRIMKYEEENPSGWDRTFDSMKYEWHIHNLAYNLNYEVARSRDVDLNNNDERMYLRKVR